MKSRLVLLSLVCLATATLAAEKQMPLKALMVTGGCCHDYVAQKKILSEGISARANVVWTIVHEGDDRDHRVTEQGKPKAGFGPDGT
jgi:hypothetical protein